MIVYIHGFNSTSASHKAAQVRARLAQEGRVHQFCAPDLPPEPAAAMALLDALVAGQKAAGVTLVGSSLGGFYATALSEKLGVRSVLVNPAIDPHVGLAPYLGPQRNLYSGAEYVLTTDHLEELRQFYVPQLTHLERYLLIVCSGDEVLDCRRAVARYRGARQIVVQGGDHGFGDFDRWLDPVWEFAGLGAPG